MVAVALQTGVMKDPLSLDVGIPTLRGKVALRDHPGMLP